MKYHVLTLALVLNLFISPLSKAQDVEIQAHQPVTVVQTAPPEQVETARYFINSEFASETLSEKQQQLLLKAYDIAVEDGHKEPAILPAVVFKESKAVSVVGLVRKTVRKITAQYREKCFGIAQIKLETAKAVLRRYPELASYLNKKTDEEIVKVLALNDDFNLRVASKYLLMMEEYGNKSIQWKAAAYNRGPGGAKGQKVGQLPYVKNIVHLVNEFKSDTQIRS